MITKRVCSRKDILDHDGARIGSIAPPKLPPRNVVCRSEEEDPVHLDDPGDIDEYELYVTAISGLIGVGLGVGVLQVIARTFYPEAVITPDSIVLGLTAALVVGVLAGSLPARQAARLQPVDALR